MVFYASKNFFATDFGSPEPPEQAASASITIANRGRSVFFIKNVLENDWINGQQM